jgi:hypothetical protein
MILKPRQLLGGLVDGLGGVVSPVVDGLLGDGSQATATQAAQNANETPSRNGADTGGDEVQTDDTQQIQQPANNAGSSSNNNNNNNGNNNNGNQSSGSGRTNNAAEGEGEENERPTQRTSAQPTPTQTQQQQGPGVSIVAPPPLSTTPTRAPATTAPVLPAQSPSSSVEAPVTVTEAPPTSETPPPASTPVSSPATTAELTLPPPSSASSFSSTFTSVVVGPASSVVIMVPPTSDSTPPALPTSNTVPATLQTSTPAENQLGGETSGGGMSGPMMAVAVAAPLAAIALIGAGVWIFKKRRAGGYKSRRKSMPYDEEFEQLQKKHLEKFGPGHNY